MRKPFNEDQNAIDPEVIPPTSNSGNQAISYLPKWALYGGIGLTALLAIGILRAIFPLLCIAFLGGLILKLSKRSQ
ncbi:hypothetical protein [Prochlorococcus sp. MIT 1341]|uniref:hypothetical protein n=1 Tax=Prochlorococcus sp. MIT 1341 TaxID=3096221 RepID=UPI002A74BCEB|nr:hypothetical protein [Prochlorococcus sp. MIT 1341]